MIKNSWWYSKFTKEAERGELYKEDGQEMLENEVENLKVTLKTEVWIEGLELLSDEQEKLNVGFVQSTSDKSL